jgi:hypothetical protein
MIPSQLFPVDRSDGFHRRINVRRIRIGKHPGPAVRLHLLHYLMICSPVGWRNPTRAGCANFRQSIRHRFEALYSSMRSLIGRSGTMAQMRNDFKRELGSGISDGRVAGSVCIIRYLTAGVNPENFESGAFS